MRARYRGGVVEVWGHVALLPAALEQHARGVRLLPALQAQLAHARRRVHVVLRALVRVGVIQGSRLFALG